MKIHRFGIPHGLLLAAICALAGCSGSDRPATHPVRGTVTYKGKPVVDASVSFLAPGAPRFAIGTTDESGNYRLTTFEPDDGAILGTHVVTVRKLAAGPEPSYAAPSGVKLDAAAIERAMEETSIQMEKAKRAGSELPARYADHKTSDLRQEVREGENVINIELLD